MAAMPVHDGDQINKFVGKPDTGYITTPELIRFINDHVL
jgi:hypothetical protein